MGKALFLKLKEALTSVLPVGIIVFALSLTPLVSLTPKELQVFGVSALLLILGIGLFNLGADLSMTPMGQHIGEGLTRSRKVNFLLIVCFLMGVMITIAEPDLSVLANQVSSLMNGNLLIVTVGIGVGIFLLQAVFKIIKRTDLTSILLFFYLLLFSLAAMVISVGKGDLLPLSFDAGGVTTGPITVPFIMALGVGIALTVGGRHANENSFGLIALCSIGPIIAVLMLSLFSKGSLSYSVPDYSMDAILKGGLWDDILRTMLEVGKSLILIVVFFVVLQVLILKLPRWKLISIGIGILITFVGLVIFLTAVMVGFMPVGYKIGTDLASFNQTYLIVLSFIIGFVVVLAEPAVHVLNQQVEQITNGEVTRRQMMIALSIGVGISIGLSILRIIYGFSLLYYLIPGYVLSLGLSFYVPKLYTAIAFDSGGVASGPLTSSFILPMAIGACMALHSEAEVLSLAFGIVAMVAMTPLITIQSLGFRAVVSQRARSKAAMKKILAADDEQIIYFQ
ncbi:MAG: DUF1538 domain-containing protein [Bacteroidales bacterium]|nr:DUF1538 domain-containing protein [Bacteroidales bacterium]MBR6423161.1 DUF1538 domain-containing protein [Bacteroidales bacterium]